MSESADRTTEIAMTDRDTEERGDVPLRRDAVIDDRREHPSAEPGDTAGMTSARSAMALARWRPFMGYFLFIADCNTPATMSPHERVRNTRTLHPRLYNTCMVFDMFLLAAIVLVLFLAGCVVAGKSLGVVELLPWVS